MIGIILGVIGTIATIAFGLYSIWIYKKTKKKVRLEFINEQCYSLFSSDVKRLNIELSYNKKKLSNPLILLKAKILNNGSVDIDKNRIFKPLKIIPQKEFIWLEARTIDMPDGASSTIKITDKNEIQIEWDLLKSGESIEFEALIEINDNNETLGQGVSKTITFYNGLKFDHRITDINSIIKESNFSIRNPFDLFLRYTRFVGLFALIFGMLIFSFEYFPSMKYIPIEREFVYTLKTDTTEFKGYVKTLNDDELIIQDLNSKTKKNTSIEEFNNDYKVIQLDSIVFSPIGLLFNKILGGLMIFMGVIFYILKLRLRKRKKREFK